MDKTRELERLRRKSALQAKEIMHLRRMLAEADGGVAELNRAADALAAAVCRQYGETIGPGQWRLWLRDISGPPCVSVTAKRSEDGRGGVYVTARQEAAHGT